MITKKFNYEGQMRSYYNKVRNNPEIEFCVCGWFYDNDGHGSYTVKYKYKKFLKKY